MAVNLFIITDHHRSNSQNGGHMVAGSAVGIGVSDVRDGSSQNITHDVPPVSDTSTAVGAGSAGSER
ncbi:hypothetical protein ACFYUD_24010 [Nocardia tengchongensis]|uniref:hypothetical protein n=1 Tax=Nocardia tengchongensis TaxID=2055889 RepID=UPI0036B7DDCA